MKLILSRLHIRAAALAAIALGVVLALSAVGHSLGSVGPTPVEESFNATGSLQTFTVPAGVTSVTIKAVGGRGGQASFWLNPGNVFAGGLGTSVQGDFTVQPGDQLAILVGSAGGDGFNGGGGGGSFVWNGSGAVTADNILIAAGAGGGACYGWGGTNASLTNSGTDGGAGGLAFQNGGGGGGGGLLTDGGDGGTTEYRAGGRGGQAIAAGGAGRGGGAGGAGGYGGGGGPGDAGGGGGGYSGGVGGHSIGYCTGGQGGGSFNGGTGPVDAAGVGNGDGVVTITYIVADVAGPTIDCTVPDQDAWHPDNIEVPCTASDDSGLDDPADASFSLFTDVAAGTEEAAAETDSHEVCDTHANCVTAGPYSFKVDRKAPTSIAFVGSIAEGDTFAASQVPTEPTCTAEDGGAGLDGCVVTGYATSVGQHTLRATATDNVSNSDFIEISYTVESDPAPPWTIQGFFGNVNMTPGAWNTIKAGSIVQFRFRVFNGATEITDTKKVSIAIISLPTCQPVQEGGQLTVLNKKGTALQYDSAAHQFIQRWETPREANKCFLARVTTEDGSKLSALFRTR